MYQVDALVRFTVQTLCHPGLIGHVVIVIVPHSQHSATAGRTVAVSQIRYPALRLHHAAIGLDAQMLDWVLHQQGQHPHTVHTHALVCL